jgi:mannitol/fructose-specific phosphotransferase system IIA component
MTFFNNLIHSFPGSTFLGNGVKIRHHLVSIKNKILKKSNEKQIRKSSVVSGNMWQKQLAMTT